MDEPADLELSLRRREGGRYSLELRFSQPQSEAEVRPLRDVTVRFDLARLREFALDSIGYGYALAAMLFADPAVAAAFAQARSAARSQGLSLRLRLTIGGDAPELHALHWETLRDPQDGALLTTSEQLLFSRYLGSPDWQPVRLRPQGELRALVVIAAPTDLANYQLPAIDAATEEQLARDSLAALPCTILSGPSATLNAMVAELRDGHDILYVICHGALVDSEPWLYFVDEAGRTARLAGRDLVTCIAELAHRPRLVVLASCHSAGDGAGAALTALGPLLAEAGVPAVLAMQGPLSLETAHRCLPVFFQELQRDGRIDRALVVARGSVRERPDFWAPALLMRLRSGRLWYVPGFAGEGFKKWPTLLRSIQRGKCTPILGPALSESLLGSSREIARRWADTYHFPLAPDARDDLPQVAQFIAVEQDPVFLRDELGQSIQQTLLDRFGARLTPAERALPLDKLILAVAGLPHEGDGVDVYRVLAGLPCPVYLSATPDGLLAAALAAAGKQPHVLVCPWNRYSEQIQPAEPPLPSAQAPLVYHLFGRLAEPESLVLTEDDYFRYLIGVTSNSDLIPDTIHRALADTALIFLGFRLEDWNFRILFQSVMNQPGSHRRRLYTHVGVQIDPEEGRTLEPALARAYLERYFGPATGLAYGTEISIYWGSAEDFIRELAMRIGEKTTE